MSLQSSECTVLSAKKNLKFIGIEDHFTTTSARRADQVKLGGVLQ